MNDRIVDASSTDEEVRDFECLVALEDKRRERESKRRSGSLEEFEKIYFGQEVGAIRRALNAETLGRLRLGGDLFDYGCGSYWWKEYWSHFDRVYAVEVAKYQLEEIGARYPNARLIYTRNGGVDAKALDVKSFDVIMSQSVVGYILPVQAKHHLRTCYELLKPGGQLMLTRVRAFNVYDFINSNRFTHISGASFSYGYTASELTKELAGLGFKDIRHSGQGVRLPMSWKANQAAYRAFPRFMASFAPRLFPMLRLCHMVTATK